MNNDRLPVGSIITIRFRENYYMIVGYETTYEDEKKDYVAIEYPLGYNGAQSLLFLTKDYIKEVVFVGYKNDLFEELNKKMNEE